MANQEHLDILKQSTNAWDSWRAKHPQVRPILSEANLSNVSLSKTNLAGVDFSDAILIHTHLIGANLSKADLSKANLSRADLSEADLSEAALIEANLYRTIFKRADLSGGDLRGANFVGANLNKANLSGADLSGAIFSAANLIGANLSGANLNRAVLINTNLTNADLTNCSIYGISAWDVKSEGSNQTNLSITPPGQAKITVDNLKIAQFIYLLLNNAEIRNVIDTIAKKAALILGRFQPERKAVLDALREALRTHGYLPILFDFEKPSSRNFTETIRTLAHLSRFIIADLTDPSSIPQELQAIVPTLAVPVQPVLLEGKREYSMFSDFFKTYHWVLPVHFYRDKAHLLTTLKEHIIEPAELKAQELENR